MEKLDIKKTFFYFWKKIWLIGIIAIAITLMGYLYYRVNNIDMYKSNTKILVNISGIDSANYSSQKNASLLLTYTEMIKSRKILTNVIKELDLDITYNTLFNRVNVSFVEDSRILDISVSDESSKNAMEIANSIAKYFTEEVSEILSLNDIIIIDEAVESNEIYNSFNIKDILKLLIAGTILGISFVFVIYYFDMSIKDVEELNIFKLPILGKTNKNKYIDDVNLIKVNIRRSINNPKTILLASSVYKEGNDFIGNNLAISFANDNEKVLIINFNIKDKNIVDSKLDKANIKKTDTDNLYILTQNPFSYNDEGLRTLLKKIEKDYDRIIIIGAPIKDLSISLIISTFVESVIVVSKIDYTKMSDLENTINSLKLVNANISGIIVNNFK